MSGGSPVQEPDTPEKKKEKIPPFSLRLTKEERQLLESLAGGMPLGTYIRSRIFKGNVTPRRTRGRVPVKDHQLLARLLGALGKSGMSDNLSILVEADKSGSLPVAGDIEAEIREACAHVAHMRSDLLRALGLRESDKSQSRGENDQKTDHPKLPLEPPSIGGLTSTQEEPEPPLQNTLRRPK